MTEQKIQSQIIRQLEDEGYYVIKLIRTNKNGIPDLIAIPKDSDVLFVEVKRPDGRLSKLQKYRQTEIKSYGIKCETRYGSDEPRDGLTEFDSE